MSRRFQIVLKRSAAKELAALENPIHDRIVEAFSVLSDNPYSMLLQVKKLKGATDLYRFRLGDYRIVYEVQRDRIVVVIVRIAHRREVYRGL